MELSKERFSCIYKIVSAINGKVYVGSAKDYRKRQQTHIIALQRCKHHSRILQHHFNKYGADDLSFEVLEIVENGSQLIEREQFYIDKINPFFNISKTAGSRLGCKASEETLSKQRNATRLPVTEECKRKISAALKGVKKSPDHNNKVSKALMGHLVSDEVKEKLRIAATGKVPSQETREKHRINSTGKKHTEAMKQKMSAERKGIPMAEETKKKISAKLTGSKLSDETKAKLREIGKKESNLNNLRKMAEGNIGRKHTEEFSQKLRERMNTPESKAKFSALHKGRKRSEETKQRMRDGKLRAKLLKQSV
jgi:group I intron endonuclease